MNNIKFTNAQQTKVVYNYKNTKAKLYKMSAAIWFKNICKIGYEYWHVGLYTFIIMTR